MQKSILSLSFQISTIYVILSCPNASAHMPLAVGLRCVSFDHASLRRFFFHTWNRCGIESDALSFHHLLKWSHGSSLWSNHMEHINFLMLRHSWIHGLTAFVFTYQLNKIPLNILFLCYVMLCYAMLCYVMLCYFMLCYIMLCSLLYRTILYYAVLFHKVNIQCYTSEYIPLACPQGDCCPGFWVLTFPKHY